MKKITIVSIIICAIAAACTKSPDDKTFIRDMYEQSLYEDYTFLERHCSKHLLAKLAEEYDYEGKGYAVWIFRSTAQDGPSREHTITDIEDLGGGWYRYTAIDMGIVFTKRIRLSDKKGKKIIEDIADNYRLITPLPSGLDVNNLQDCTVSAAFTPDDFRWMGGTLDMTVFSRDLYDVVDIATMHVGDTIIYDSRPMVISTIDNGNYGIDINKGPDNGGCRLVGYGGGTYVAKLSDARTVYTELGKAHLALDQDFIIIDCGTGPNDTSDTIRSAQKLYIEKMNERRLQFTQFDTRVTIENGLITIIARTPTLVSR